MVTDGVTVTDCVTCTECGWVHKAVTREFAVDAIATFSRYFCTLTEEQKRDYGGKESSIADYEACFRCGNSYKNMRPTEDGDIPKGYAVTISPIIWEPQEP